MNAVILCDASYDDDYGLSGYAGAVTFAGKKQPYAGAFAGVLSSNESELYAVYEGLKQLIEHKGGKEVKSVQIFSDSNNALDRLKNKKKDLKRSELELFLLKQIRKIANDNSLEMAFHHVKAHQKNATASIMEKRHNEVDKLARREMISRRKVFQSPKQSESNFYGVVLDSNPSARLSEQYKALGYRLASSGYVARAHVQGDGLKLEDHPFYEGIKQYSKENQVSMHKLLSEYFFSSKEVDGFTDRMLGCQGMDSCLLRKHLMETGEFRDVDRRSVSANAAGAASRLLYGYQARVKGSEVATSNYSEQPSKFILNLALENAEGPAVTDWIGTFAEMIETPYMRNIKALDNVVERSGVSSLSKGQEETIEMVS